MIRLARSMALLGLPLFFAVLTPFPAVALVNGGFENGDLTGWTVSTTSNFGNVSPYAVVVGPGPAPYTNGNLNDVYLGNYACELYSGYGAAYHYDSVSISQTEVIGASDYYFEFYFAAVLDGTHAALPSEDAYVEVLITDNTAGVVIVQKTYAYASSPAPLVDDGVTNKRHLPWTKISLDLSSAIGHSVTFKMSAYDCNQSGHEALAYVDGFSLVPPTPTQTPSFTLSSTITPTPTATPTLTRSPTPTRSPTRTASPTRTLTPTRSSTPTWTQTFTASPTKTMSPTPSSTRTRSFTVTDSPTRTISPSPTDTFTSSPTFTASPTWSVTPTISVTPSHTPTATVTPPQLILHPYPASPNPFGGAGTYLTYWVQVDARVMIRVYTISGEVVRDLEPFEAKAGNNHEFWDGRNSSNAQVASGTFIYRIEAVSKRDEHQAVFGKVARLR